MAGPGKPEKPDPPDAYGVIVVGGGHAGCEAALAAARLGQPTLLVSLSLARVAALSCNPAVGGLAKGHLVKEIDALGGEMGLAADAAGIQFRLLNSGKGPAVWSSRAQVDMDRYPARLQRACAGQEGLWLWEDEVVGLVVRRGRACGVRTASGRELAARAVVLTAGTFLRGVIHLGLEQTPAGRWGDPPSNALSAQLGELGFVLLRLKTGTTPRLEAASLELGSLPQQWGDAAPRRFSFLSQGPPELPQICCWLTRTTAETHRLIRDNLDRAPMYAGRITGRGARYCPSIEDKVVRFADRESHQVFLEPQGLASPLIYPNGIPTSLPAEVQLAMVRSLPGCGAARVARPGYAIEYDMADPLDLEPGLESRRLPGLFLAGQVNGTSGYEEAACQGLLAGVNAARAARGEGPAVLDRAQAYTGVLVDDLVTRGTGEPYRMFTSRAEYRLSLREDNADLRLTPLGREWGLVDDRRWQAFTAKRRAIRRAWELLAAVRLRPTAGVNDALAALGQAPLRQPATAAELLQRPGLGLAQALGLAPELEPLAGLEPEAAEEVEIQAHYAGYEARQQRQVERFRQREAVPIPPGLDFAAVGGLSREAVEKLSRVRPANLGQAGRISGVTPAAVAVLSVHLHRLARQGGGPA
jgi:tRNA uridine 5-carboxymethylaminomethyl modification enzyme